jgi:hypothetical protein
VTAKKARRIAMAFGGPELGRWFSQRRGPDYTDTGRSCLA